MDPSHSATRGALGARVSDPVLFGRAAERLVEPGATGMLQTQARRRRGLKRTAGSYGTSLGSWGWT